VAAALSLKNSSEKKPFCSKKKKKNGIRNELKLKKAFQKTFVDCDNEFMSDNEVEGNIQKWLG
jgi:hypothetical protein